MPKRCSCEAFIKQVNIIHPDIEVLGDYINAHTRINCRCKKCGNEWTPIAYSLLNGAGCPKCARKKAGEANSKVKDPKNSLLFAFPDVVFVWNYEKNGPLKPEEVKPKSNKKVWWKCSKCGKEWETTVIRKSHNTLCAQCSRKTTKRVTLQEGINDLASRTPELLQEWNYKKNIIQPSEISYKSTKKVWWKCEKGHEWNSSPYERTRHGVSRCPFCSNRILLKGINDLASQYPELIKDWDYLKNSIEPEDYHKGSNKKVWWKCKDCGYEWQTTIANRTNQKHGCPVCAAKRAGQEHKLKAAKRNNLAELYPELIQEWDFDKNGSDKPDDFACSSNRVVWWKCKNCGHEWRLSIANKTKMKYGCPICAAKIIAKQHSLNSAKKNNLAKEHPELVPEWDYAKNEGRPEDYPCASDYKAWWKCSWCGNEWQTQIKHRAQRYSGCPECRKGKSTSFPEQAIFFYIKQLFFDTRNRDDSTGKELDIYIPSKRIAIEFDGARWHSSEKISKKDQDKNNFCAENGIELYRVRNEKSPVIDNAKIIYIKDESKEELERSIRKLIQDIAGKNVFKINLEKDAIAIIDQYKHNQQANSIASRFPDIAKDWHPDKNGALTPDHVSWSDGHKYWWKCHVCGHEWQATPNHSTRRNVSSCPVCSRKRISDNNHVMVKNIDTGVIFDSLTDAAKSCNGTKPGICSCCNGKIKTHRGFRWEYVDAQKRRQTHYTGRVIDLDNHIVYANLAEAAKSCNGDPRNLNKCCRGDHKTCKGIHWAYYDNTNPSIIINKKA